MKLNSTNNKYLEAYNYEDESIISLLYYNIYLGNEHCRYTVIIHTDIEDNITPIFTSDKTISKLKIETKKTILIGLHLEETPSETPTTDIFQGCIYYENLSPKNTEKFINSFLIAIGYKEDSSQFELEIHEEKTLREWIQEEKADNALWESQGDSY